MKENVTISISTGTIIRVFISIVIFFGLFYVSDFIIALLVSVVLASAVEMPVRLFVKWGIPRAIAVIGIFLSLLILFAATVLIFIPPLAGDIALFIKTLPTILESVRIFGRDLGFKDLSVAIADLSRDISKGEILSIIKTSVFGSSGFFATTTVVIGSLINILLTFVIAFYLALEEHGVQQFLKLVVPKKHEAYASDLWERSQKKIGLWMQGQLLLSFLVSLLVYIPMLILDMPYATLLAILAFTGELIPMVGLTLATVPALFLAWVHGGMSLVGIVAVIYFIIAQLENHVLYPKVMNKMVGVPSVVVIIAIVIGAKIAGIWGVLLAVPLASILMELADDIDKRKNHIVEHHVS
jgi:predicted PurR-regulated permease PerM